MIYIAINVFFNAFVLAFIMVLGTDILHIPSLIAWCLAYIISGGLTILGYTRLGTWAVSLFVSGRQMIGRERAKLEPLLQDVIDNTNREYGTTYQLSDFKIKVTDDKVVNAFALGYNTITINCGAFGAFTDEQLRAILAHEMGHLYYRDSVRNIALIFSSFATRIIMTLYGMYLAIAALISQNAKGEHASAIALGAWFPALIFLPVVVLNWIGTKVFTLLSMRMSRGAEYRADAFAASLGYKADMIIALEVLNDITVYDNSFISKLMATHPSPMLRIGALEDGTIARQKIGGLFVATPFATDNAAHLSGNSEVIRLATILGIAGVLWMGWGVYSGMSMKHIPAKPALNQPVVAANNNPVKNTRNTPVTTAPWVYIYNTGYIDKQHYKVSYKLRNKGSMQDMIVRQQPKTYKMSLAELEALQ